MVPAGPLLQSPGVFYFEQGEYQAGMQYSFTAREYRGRFGGMYYFVGPPGEVKQLTTPA